MGSPISSPSFSHISSLTSYQLLLSLHIWSLDLVPQLSPSSFNHQFRIHIVFYCWINCIKYPFIIYILITQDPLTAVLLYAKRKEPISQPKIEGFGQPRHNVLFQPVSLSGCPLSMILIIHLHSVFLISTPLKKKKTPCCHS